MIKKGRDKHIKLSVSLIVFEKQKLHCAELIISLKAYKEGEWKISRKRGRKEKTKNTNAWDKYNQHVPSH